MFNIESKKIFFLFIIVLILSFFIRIYYINWETLTYGEAELLQASDEYNKGNFIKNFYNFDTPPLIKYITAASISLLGFSEISMRIIPVIFGMLTVFMTFVFAKKFYNEITALFASVLVSFSFVCIEFSRYALYDSAMPFLFLLTAYFFLDNSKKSWLILGIVVGFGMLTKYNFFFIIIAMFLFPLLINKSISLQNLFNKKMLKALSIAILVFFILWPFSLVPIKINLNYSVPNVTNIGSGEATLNIPIFALSMGKRIITSSQTAILGTFEDIPFINYIFIYLIKENILITIILFTGIFYLFKNKISETDKFLILAIFISFFMLIFQRWNYSPRHILPVVPFILILAAKQINILKEKINIIFIVFMTTILFLSALFVTPLFALYNNNISSFIGEPRAEGYLSEGMKETITYIEKNCSHVLADAAIVFQSIPYTNKTSIKQQVFDCYVDYDVTEIPEKCILDRIVKKEGKILLNIYRCG